MRGQTGPATLSAWNTNRSQNLQQLIDIMPPAATAMDVGAEAIFALKMKVIVDVTTTMISLVAMLTNPVTAFSSTSGRMRPTSRPLHAGRPRPSRRGICPVVRPRTSCR